MMLNEVLERDICLKVCHMTQHSHQMSEVKFEKSEGIELLVASVIINKTECSLSNNIDNVVIK